MSFAGPHDVRLTESELGLVCGDRTLEGWSAVPVSQARYFLRVFLQQRGYHDPRFSVSSAGLRVSTGEKSRIRGLSVSGLPDAVDPSKLRGIVGGELTPKALDKARAALTRALQNKGYPCAAVSMAADPVSGRVVADVAGGGERTIDRIAPPRLSMVEPGVLSRYEAFRPGQRFDMRLLALTSERLLADSLFVGAYYDVSCSTAGLTISQRVVEGKPRLYQVGAGFDTEDYAIAKVQWRNSRIDARGGSLEGALYGSFRRQSAEASMREYPSSTSRFHLRPRVEFNRESNLQFESVKAEVSVLPGVSRESETFRAEVAAGPSREYVRTVRGPGPENDTFLSFKTQSILMDHLFEYHAGEPREGWRWALDTASRLAGADSSFTAHRLSAQGQRLWNVGNFDPPLLVAGNRLWLGSTYLDAREAGRRRLAPDMRFYLGGDANFRGASLKGLPRDDAGFLTVVYDGLELRLGDVLGRGLQPLIFLDAAMGGRRDMDLDPDVYWSPGGGIRWALPVGSIRATAARGFLWRRSSDEGPLYRPRWQFFFSFGKEF